MTYFVVLVIVGGGFVVIAAVGAFFAWKMGDRLQRGGAAGSRAGSSDPIFTDVERLFVQVRAKLSRNVDDAELASTLARHLDDLQAKKNAAAVRVAELDELLRSPAPEATRAAKLAERKSLTDGVSQIGDGLRETLERLTKGPDAAQVSKGIAESLGSLHGELDAEDRARREIAALEKR